MIRQYVKIRVCHVKSEEYLDNILSRLQRDNEVLNRIEKRILEKNEYFLCLKLGAKKLFLSLPEINRGGRNPFILAASIIIAADILLARHVFFPHCYFRSSKRGILTQKYIANLLNTAEFTLREHYLLLAKPLLESVIHMEIRNVK